MQCVQAATTTASNPPLLQRPARHRESGIAGGTQGRLRRLRVAANLLDADAHGLLRPASAFGPLLEGFVVSEIARQLTWSRRRVELSHYRTKDGVEVDIFLEDRQGHVVGIEVKAASTVRSEDFRGLRHLADRLGPDLIAGVVLYTGRPTLSFGERMRAMPISSVWQVG